MWKEELLAEGWMQELTESSAGSLESEEDFGLSEAGPCWAAGAAEVDCSPQGCLQAAE